MDNHSIISLCKCPFCGNNFELKLDIQSQEAIEFLQKKEVLEINPGGTSCDDDVIDYCNTAYDDKIKSLIDSCYSIINILESN